MSILRNIVFRLLEAAGADGAAGGGGGDGGDAGAPDPKRVEVEQRAQEMGWAPKAQWQGNPDSWIDAPEFIQRGEQILPILRSNLRRRDTEVAELKRKLDQQNAQLQIATESIQVLTNLSTEQSRAAAREKRKELMQARVQARTDGDAAAEVALDEQIADVTAQINAAETEAAAAKANGKDGKPAAAAAAQQPTAAAQADNPASDPEYIQWTKENPWYGTDGRKTALAVAIGKELRTDPANANLLGKAFFDRVTAEVNKIFAPARATTGKTESGAGGGAAGANTSSDDSLGGKSYNDLPADAKQACERQAKLLVGEGRAFKDVAAWRKHYVQVYFSL